MEAQQFVDLMPLTENEPENYFSVYPEYSSVTTGLVFHPTVQPLSVSRALVCLICGDKKTGKHYGAYSCDGCKGFFRRSIRIKREYKCRFNQSCVVDKRSRNQCRYCRLKKCFSAGMRREAVQKERDQIKMKGSLNEEEDLVPIVTLLKAEGKTQASNIKGDEVCCSQTNDDETFGSDKRTVASVKDIGDSMTQEVVALVNWAKSIPVFTTLSEQDQVKLIHAHACKNLVMGVAKRSYDYLDILLLGNNTVIPRENCIQPEVKVITDRIMDELVAPVAELGLDETEFACLKALIFFDFADVKTLSSRSQVESIRRSILRNLEDYINNLQFETRGRFGEILLLLPILQSISAQVVDLIDFIHKTGIAVVDKYLQEIILQGRRGFFPLYS